jgi:polyferredoxin
MSEAKPDGQESVSEARPDGQEPASEAKSAGQEPASEAKSAGFFRSFFRNKRLLKRRLNTVLRLAIQVVFFIVFPSLFAAGFTGARYVVGQIASHDPINFNLFVLNMLILFASVVLFGRFFCGYLCAFGSIGDWLYLGSSRLFKLAGKKPPKLPARLLHVLQYFKYLVLVAILVACLTNTYQLVSNYDPWSAFAALISGNPSSIQAHEGWQIACIVLGVIVIGMLLVERFFCQFLCPMGALLGLLPMLPLFLVSRNKERCIQGCKVCARVCPAALSLGEERSVSGECFQCDTCRAACPKGNVKSLIDRTVWFNPVFVIGKAVLIGTICYLFIR